jgi:catechol 2,3-dioxygenase
MVVTAMPPTLQLESVHLRVPDLPRSTEFYTRQLGFVVAAHADNRVQLATMPGAASLLTLTGDPAAPLPPRDAAGLFHAALLFPTRPALGTWLRGAAEREVGFDGFSDHGVSEAIYFADPDGNGLEFYADRPRASWPFAANGEVAMMTEPLDAPALLEAGGPATEFPLAGARWGHLHLRTIDLPRSEAFYRDHLGLQVTQRSYPGARFLAADGYHHHLGLNTWSGPRRPKPADALGLVGATFARAGIDSAQEFIGPEGYMLTVEPLA